MLEDFLLKQLLHVMVKRANDKLDVSSILKKYNSEGRTIVILINGVKGDAGFNVANGKIVYGVELKNPTCTIQMDRDTFLAIASRKISQQQAYMMGAVNYDGRQWLRDSILVDKIFSEMKDVMLPENK